MEKALKLIRWILATEARQIIFMAICLFPLCLMNIKSTHDWGDDFAMYISQAKCILEGRPQTDNGFVYNNANPELSPKAFNGGFPLLLAPILSIWGLDFIALNYYQSFWLFCFGLISFYFLSMHFRLRYAMTTVLLMCYSPFLLNYKTEIMCDIPFSVFFLLGIILYLKQKPFWLVALLMTFACVIKINGNSFLMAIFAINILKQLAKKETIFKITYEVKIGSIVFISYLLINNLIFAIPSLGADYLTIYTHNSLLDALNRNLDGYSNLITGFFNYTGSISFEGFMFSAFLFCAFLVGWIKDFFKQRSFVSLLVFFYATPILFYPYNSQVLRYMIPIMPFAFYYSLTTFQGFNFDKKIIWIVLSYVLFKTIAYPFNAFYLNKFKDENSSFGPYSPAGSEAITATIKYTAKTSIVLFPKPRALSLFTARKGFVNHFSDSPKEVLNQIEKNKIEFCLVSQKDMLEFNNPSLDNLVKTYPQKFKIIFKGDYFNLYKIDQQHKLEISGW